MAKEKVSAKTKLEDGTVVSGEFEYDFGNDLKDAVSKFGDQIVFGYFRAHAVVQAQAGARRCLESKSDLKAWAAGWKPGVSTPRIVDPIAAAKAAYAKMDPAAKAAFLAQLKSLG